MYFSQSNVVLQDDRNTIKVVEFNNEPLVIKSFKRPHPLNRFIYSYLKKSKARRAYEFALKIPEFTPKAIAYIEYSSSTLLTNSYFICEKFDADFNMQAPLFQHHPDKTNILRQFAQFVFQLHGAQILHQDLSPGNILIGINDSGYEFQIIDINRMVFKPPSIRQRAKNFSKLWANDDDLRLMLKVYASMTGLGSRFIELGLKYNQQNKARKTRKRKIKQAIGWC